MTTPDERTTQFDGIAELQRARMLLDLGRTAQATQLLASLIGRRPDDPRAWTEMARARRAEGDLRSALQAAGSAIALDPNSSTAYVLASDILDRQGQTQRAEQMARQAVRITPEHWGAHAMLGIILTRPNGRHRTRRRRKEAVAAGRHAVALAPQLAASHVAWGAIAAATGSRSDARAAFLQALRLEPNNSAAHNDLARLQMTRPLRGPGQLAAAATGFSTAVSTDPASAASRSNLEKVMYAAVSTTAYLVFLIAWLLRPSVNPDQLGWRLVPVVALSAPALFAWRFWKRLTPALRDHLRYLVTRSELRGSCALAGTAVVCMLAGAVAPHGPRQFFTVSAVLVAFSARVWLWVCARRRSGKPGSALIRMSVLWILVSLVGGTSVLMFVAAAIGPDSGPELVAATMTGAVTVVLLVLLRRRRLHKVRVAGSTRPDFVP